MKIVEGGTISPGGVFTQSPLSRCPKCGGGPSGPGNYRRACSCQEPGLTEEDAARIKAEATIAVDQWIRNNKKGATGMTIAERQEYAAAIDTPDKRPQGATPNGPVPDPNWVCEICDGGPGNNSACACPTEMKTASGVRMGRLPKKSPNEETGVIDTAMRANGILVTVKRIVTYSLPNGVEYETEDQAERALRMTRLKAWWDAQFTRGIAFDEMTYEDMLFVMCEHAEDLVKILRCQ